MTFKVSRTFLYRTHYGRPFGATLRYSLCTTRFLETRVVVLSEPHRFHCLTPTLVARQTFSPQGGRGKGEGGSMGMPHSSSSPSSSSTRSSASYSTLMKDDRISTSRADPNGADGVEDAWAPTHKREWRTTNLSSTHENSHGEDIGSGTMGLSPLQQEFHSRQRDGERRAAMAAKSRPSSSSATQEMWIRRVLVVLAASAAFGVVYYFTTTTYVLTTDTSPYKNTMFQHFPSDYAIIENKWTGRRRVISLEEEAKSLEDEERRRWEAQLKQNQTILTHFDSEEPPTARPISRKIPINRLKDRIHCYLQKKKSLVLVDVTAELAADRFMTIKNDTREVESMERSKIGARRASDTYHREKYFEEYLQENRHPSQKKNKKSGKAPPLAGREEPEEKRAVLLIQSVVRPLETVNGYQKGQLPRYEQTLQTVCREVIAQRYEQLLLRRVGVSAPTTQELHASSNKSKSKNGNSALSAHYVLATELLRQGVVSGKGITVSDVIPDMQAFAAEVQQEASNRMGKEIILYDFQIRLQERTVQK